MNKTDNLIFKAAIKTFSQKGFCEATMDDIAEAAGVAKGTLYYHFESKEDIFRFIINEGMKEIEERIIDRTVYLSESLDKLREAFKVQLGLTIEYKDFFRILFSQLWGDEERQLEIRQMLSGYFSFIENYLREVVDEETLQNNDMEQITYSFFGMVVSTVLYGMINKDKDINGLANKLLECTMKSVK